MSLQLFKDSVPTGIWLKGSTLSKRLDCGCETEGTAAQVEFDEPNRGETIEMKCYILIPPARIAKAAKKCGHKLHLPGASVDWDSI